MNRPDFHRPGSPSPVRLVALVVLAAASCLGASACLGAGAERDGCVCREEAPSAAGAAPQASAEATQALVPAATDGAHDGAPADDGAALERAQLPDFSDPSWTRTESRLGRYLVCWRPLTGQVPRNEDFTLEVWVLRDGAPVRDALLAVNAWMPDHGHGMLRRPTAEAQPDGSFRILGMLLHMRGHWQLMFEVAEQGLSETAECALEL